MPLVTYSLLRLGMLVVALVGLALAGMGGWLLVVVATVVAFVLSYVLLPRQRDAAAQWLADRAARRSGARGGGDAAGGRGRFPRGVEDDAAAEDAEAERAEPESPGPESPEAERAEAERAEPESPEPESLGPEGGSQTARPSPSSTP